ncbi:MAG TPA: hypothetical protein VLA09_01235 [Longimicrobiales bacterium]|nr:hypothetical protein [Longimicrobiales bacterium]
MAEENPSDRPVPQRPVRLRVKILFVLLLGSLLLLPEIAVRAMGRLGMRSVGPPAFVAISDGYALRDDIMRDWATLRVQYYDYFLYAPMSGRSETMSFTEYFGARSTPSSVEGPDVEEVVWAFGGSTLKNIEAIDELTLANQIVHELNARGVPSRLHNFGVRAFQTSLELIRFQELLRAVPEPERPTTVIFYDGYNDARYGYLSGAGYPQSDFSSKLSDVIEQNHGRLLVYGASQWLSRYSFLWRRLAGPPIEAVLHGGKQPDGSTENLEASVNVYAVNIAVASGICEEFGIRCLFFLQPLLATRSALTPFEEDILATIDPGEIQFTRDFYALARDVLGQRSDFHDLSTFYDESDEPVFFDFGHTSPTAGIPMGKEIATRILAARELDGGNGPSTGLAAPMRDSDD